MKKKLCIYLVIGLCFIVLTGCNKNELNNQKRQEGEYLEVVQGVPENSVVDIKSQGSIEKNNEFQNKLLYNTNKKGNDFEEINKWSSEVAKIYEKDLENKKLRKQNMLEDIQKTDYFKCLENDEIEFTFNDEILEKYPNLYFMWRFSYKGLNIEKENVKEYFVDVILNNCLNIIENYSCDIDILGIKEKILYQSVDEGKALGKYFEIDNDKGKEMSLGNKNIFCFNLSENHFIYTLYNGIIIQEDIVLNKRDITDVLQLIKNTGGENQVVSMLDKKDYLLDKMYDYDYLLKYSSDNNPIALFWQAEDGYVTTIGFFGDKVVVRNTLNIIGYQTIKDLGF